MTIARECLTLRLAPVDRQVLDPVSLAKQIETNIGWFGLERQ